MNEKKSILTKEEALCLKKTYPTPFYIYDENGITKNCEKLLGAFSWNQGYKEYFAVKATPNPFILKLLKNLGCGVDCSSKTELLMAEALGFKGDDIMFSSNETPDDEFALALKLGAIINLDDITHIDALSSLGKLPARICLRYNPGGDFKIGNLIMGQPADAKYGMTPAQIHEAVRRLTKLGVKKFGLHAFLASNTLGNDYYPALADVLFKLAADLIREEGADIDFINLSGGIGVPYRESEDACDIGVIAKKVAQNYCKHGFKDLKIFTELGRYMLAPYGQLVSTVVRFKDTYKHYAGLDSCAANLMRPAMYGAYHHMTVLGKEKAAKDTVYDVVGALCENNDKFAVDRALPKLDEGDILVMHDAGAHGFSMGYNYNGKLRSAEILKQKDGSFKLIRRAETPSDYFTTFNFMDEFKNR